MKREANYSMYLKRAIAMLTAITAFVTAMLTLAYKLDEYFGKETKNETVVQKYYPDKQKSVYTVTKASGYEEHEPKRKENSEREREHHPRKQLKQIKE